VEVLILTQRDLDIYLSGTELGFLHLSGEREETRRLNETECGFGYIGLEARLNDVNALTIF
jgi:hypothetical protein